MGLEQELADFRVEFERTAPPGRAALYSAKIEELRATFPLSGTLAVGDTAPGFVLQNANGRQVSLTDVLAKGPAIVIFYRGGWCPYCNIQLKSYQRALQGIKGLGGQILAISPQLPDGSLSVAEKNALGFEVLSDVGNVVARSFGLVYALADELRAALISNNKALPGINGDDSWELPVPATFIVAPDRRVTLSHIDVDYRRRLAPEDVIRSLEALGLSSPRLF